MKDMIKSFFGWLQTLSPVTMLEIGFVLIVIGFLFQPDLAYDDSPVTTSYSVSLGEACDADYSQCRVRPLPAVGYRVETSLNEVVEFSPGNGGLMTKYKNCTLWNADNWNCEGGRIAMNDGVLVRNDFAIRHDIRYVQKIAWKLARLRSLPLSFVHHAPAPAPVEHKA